MGGGGAGVGDEREGQVTFGPPSQAQESELPQYVGYGFRLVVVLCVQLFKQGSDITGFVISF